MSGRSSRWFTVPLSALVVSRAVRYVDIYQSIVARMRVDRRVALRRYFFYTSNFYRRLA